MTEKKEIQSLELFRKCEKRGFRKEKAALEKKNLGASQSSGDGQGKKKKRAASRLTNGTSKILWQPGKKVKRAL